jgi:hypothetical protein
MIRVKLSASEIAICNYVGKYRNHITSQHGTERKQDQSQDGLQMSINGVITEYAVSKFLNVHFDLNCDFRKFGADLISAKGATIDVKCATKEGGNLSAVFWSTDKPCDVFVLTEIHPLHVRIVGWISREDFLQDENIRDVGNGPFYSVPQSRLNHFHEHIDKKTL